ncbi:MAG: hypothetical protein IJL05_04165 [Alphaproteobacteria bacterium]|nr:hypothetical protein [Alphaproteobacteria bacterium]
MIRKKKNIYLAAFYHEIETYAGIGRICRALGRDARESNAYCWIEDGRTEKEIVALLRKIGYDIPKDFKGSADIKFDGKED